MRMEAAAPASNLALRSSLAAVAADIKLSHSVFALPFALLAMVLAGAWRGEMPTASEVALIVACMVLARTVAMAANRLADAAIDARNPRTAGRALPSGRVSRGFVLALAAPCTCLFFGAAAGFWLLRGNPWPLVLSPLVLAWLVGYSYTKRFTWLCHVYLGAALALSPVAAAIAIAPGFLGEPTVWLLFAMVVGWVAGFDIIYALQDVTVDVAEGLRSMPSRFGTERALWISRALHMAVIAVLLALWRTSPHLGVLFLGASGVVAGLLVLEHALVWRSETKRLDLAFFTVNGVISLLLGAAGIADTLITS